MDKNLRRIISGEWIGKDFSVVQPTPRDLYRAELIYQASMDDASESGIRSEASMRAWMDEVGLWSAKLQSEMDRGVKSLEDAKVSLYENRKSVNGCYAIRQVISDIRRETGRVAAKLFAYDQFTQEGYARYCRGLWLFERCLRDPDGLPFPPHTPFLLVDFYSRWLSERLEEADYRDLARAEAWSSIWGCRENSGCGVFGKASSLLSDEQKFIITWSQLYDNVRDTPEAPEEYVIADNDMFDGWMIIRRRKLKLESDQRSFDSPNEKVRNANQVFHFVDNHEDAQIVESMNGPAELAIKAQRAKQVIESGSVKFAEFHDVQSDIAIAINNQTT